ncbi:hypothetical protein GCM10023195_18080 [Actinoallomurus liliacearum]|uniref:Uncharacterized protein n=1 Tax=Actinoallomurus liliacearum TaxID=1080073 RepID=A0ABP8TFS7_9ACTN
MPEPEETAHAPAETEPEEVEVVAHTDAEPEESTDPGAGCVIN